MLLVSILSIIFREEKEKKKLVESRYSEPHARIKIIIAYQSKYLRRAIYIIVRPICQVSFCRTLNLSSSEFASAEFHSGVCNFSCLFPSLFFFSPSLEPNVVHFYAYIYVNKNAKKVYLPILRN